MERSFYDSHKSEFFENKEAVMLRTITNNGGDIMRKGRVVIIRGKLSGKRGGGFHVASKYPTDSLKKIYLRGVQPCDLELK